jgi:hypothetical protein
VLVVYCPVLLHHWAALVYFGRFSQNGPLGIVPILGGDRAPVHRRRVRAGVSMWGHEGRECALDAERSGRSIEIREGNRIRMRDLVSGLVREGLGQ